jgi:hypothetical protein
MGYILLQHPYGWISSLIFSASSTDAGRNKECVAPNDQMIKK